MSQRTPSEALQRTWLKAVLLPGIDDPRESCLTELGQYSGRPPEEVLARCEQHREQLKERWEEQPRDDSEAIDEFYRDADAHIYGLLWWHCLQRGPAVA